MASVSQRTTELENNTPKLTISKLDAARRQLEIAVRLYFVEADPVSIHTLTSTAYQLLADINKAIGGSPMLKEQVPTWVRPDASDEARRRLNEAANFFKHADRDHEAILEFNSNPTWLWLYDACQKYHELTQEAVPILYAFVVWCWIGPGHDLVKGPEREHVREQLKQMFPNPGLGRATFLHQVLPIVTSLEL